MAQISRARACSRQIPARPDSPGRLLHRQGDQVDAGISESFGISIVHLQSMPEFLLLGSAEDLLQFLGQGEVLPQRLQPPGKFLPAGDHQQFFGALHDRQRLRPFRRIDEGRRLVQGAIHDAVERHFPSLRLAHDLFSQGLPVASGPADDPCRGPHGRQDEDAEE